jgi:hypothetical protein
MTIREWIESFGDDDEILVMDEYDDALLGICIRIGQQPIAIYDKTKILDILTEEMWADREFYEFTEKWEARESAHEHFDYNVSGTWAGEGTPCFLVRPEV